MNSHPDIAGREFDWFAVDRAGAYALLATAGDGPVPAVVLAKYEEHDGISEILPCTHWGSDKIWDDYAALGLYVYDWSCGKYVRQRVPGATISAALQSTLDRISSLPRLKLEFKLHDAVEPRLITDT